MTIGPTYTSAGGVPIVDVDLHDDAVLINPEPVHTRLRDLGPVVFLSRYGYYACAGYDEVAQILSDWQSFSSANGAGFNEVFNAISGSSLHTEGALHDEIRRVEGQPLTPKSLAVLKDRLRLFAEELVKGLRPKDVLDAVPDIAKPMPARIVTDLIGIDGITPDQLYSWGGAAFDCAGPIDAPRTGPALQSMAAYAEFAQQNFPQRVRPGGWAEQLFTNGRNANWSVDFCRGVLNDYIYPSIDSTISAIGIGILLFGRHPDQWELLRDNRNLLKSAIPEIVRMASPLQLATRMVTADTEIAGVPLPKNARVVVLYGAANRDPRKFADPDRFDISRPAIDHLGWGRGVHSCLGRSLAQLEMVTLFDVLADQVDRFCIGEYRYQPNNTVRSLAQLELRIDWTAGSA